LSCIGANLLIDGCKGFRDLASASGKLCFRLTNVFQQLFTDLGNASSKSLLHRGNIVIDASGQQACALRETLVCVAECCCYLRGKLFEFSCTCLRTCSNRLVGLDERLCDASRTAFKLVRYGLCTGGDCLVCLGKRVSNRSGATVEFFGDKLRACDDHLIRTGECVGDL